MNNDKSVVFNEQGRNITKLITRLNLGVLFNLVAILDNSNTYCHYYLEIRKLFIPKLPLKITNPCKQYIMNNVTKPRLDYVYCAIHLHLIMKDRLIYYKRTSSKA